MTHKSGVEQLKELGAKNWKPFFTLVAAVLFIPNTLKQVGIPVERIPGVSSLTSGSKLGYLLILVGILLFIIIRFPKVAITVTRWILGSPELPLPEKRIFRGPRPYRNEDKDSFPGRYREVEDCWLGVQEQSFFILEGESGCGKTSLLNAGLIPKACGGFRIVESRIADDPLGKLRSAFLQEPYRRSGEPVSAESLTKAIDIALRDYAIHAPSNRHPTEPLLLCIDQFEELFVTVKGEKRLQVMTVLKTAIEGGNFRLLIGIRTDFSDLLIKLCRAVDPDQNTLSVGNYYNLRAFRAAQAHAVLEKLLGPVHQGDPVKKQDLDNFIEALIHDLLRPSGDKRLFPDEEKSVLPVELQTVGMMLEDIGSSNFTLTGLRQRGGKAGLLRTYIDDAKDYVWRSTAVSGDQALLILRQLISPARTKWAQTAESIHKSLGIPMKQIENVLEAYTKKYLVNKLPSDVKGVNAEGEIPGRYELMHEHLVHVLVEAPQPILQRARDAEERLQFWEKRTKATVSYASSGRHSFVARVKSLFAQPIPVIESARLLRFAPSDSARRMLRRNLRGYALRLIAVLLILCIPVSGWSIWVMSDTYQIRTVLSDAPTAQAVSTGGGLVAFNTWTDALVQASKFNEALAVCTQVGSIHSRLRVLIHLATTLRKAGKTNEVDKVLVEAKAIVNQHTDYLITADIYDYYVVLHRANRTNEAKTLIYKRFKELSDVAKTDPTNTMFERSEVARVLHQLGETQTATQLLNELLTDVDTRAKLRPLGYAYISDTYPLALALAYSGRAEEGVKVLMEYTSEGRLLMLFRIAEKLLDDEKVNEAEKVVNLILKTHSLATEIPAPSSNHLLTTAFSVLARTGNLTVAINLIQGYSDDASRYESSLLTLIGLVSSGRNDDAKRLYEMALASGRKANSESKRSSSLATLGGLLSQIERTDNTKAILDEALEHHSKIDDDSERSLALANIAMGYARLGLYRQARLICDRCSSVDKLKVYSVILSEYSKVQR